MRFILQKRIGMHRDKKRNLLIIDFFTLIILIFLDQLTKYFAVTNLKDKDSYILADGIFELHYLENRGAAFGMLQDQKVFFVLVASIILAAIVYILFRMPYHKKYIKLHACLVLIASGAIGNLIDRIRLNYVVDFFYFCLINFPIFNVADIYVTVASVLLVILLLFVYKEEDLEFLSIRSK